MLNRAHNIAVTLLLIFSAATPAAESDVDALAKKKLNAFAAQTKALIDEINTTEKKEAEANECIHKMHPEYLLNKPILTLTSREMDSIQSFYARQRQRRSELNKLQSRLVQIEQYAGHPQIALSMGDNWDPRAIPTADRLDLFVTCSFLDAPLHKTLAFLAEATGTEIEFGQTVARSEKVIVGQCILAIGLLATLALLTFVVVRAIAKRERLRYSLRWLLALTICAGLALHGYIRWQQTEASWKEYYATNEKYFALRNAAFDMTLKHVGLLEIVKEHCKFEDADFKSYPASGKIVIYCSKSEKEKSK